MSQVMGREHELSEQVHQLGNDTHKKGSENRELLEQLHERVRTADKETELQCQRAEAAEHEVDQLRERVETAEKEIHRQAAASSKISDELLLSLREAEKSLSEVTFKSEMQNREKKQIASYALPGHPTILTLCAI
jgi:hypothetical protein